MPDTDFFDYADSAHFEPSDIALVARGAGGVNVPMSSVAFQDSLGFFRIGGLYVSAPTTAEANYLSDRHDFRNAADNQTFASIEAASFSVGSAANFAGAVSVSGAISATGSTSSILFRGSSGGASNNTGCLIGDAGPAFHMKIACGSTFTAARRLTFTIGDSNRTLNISAGDVTISAAGASLIDDADVTAMRATLDLVIGTSGNAVPKLNGAATTWAAGATFGGILQSSGEIHSSGNGVSAKGLWTAGGVAGLHVFMDVNSGIGRYGCYNSSLGSYQPFDILGSTITIKPGGSTAGATFGTNSNVFVGPVRTSQYTVATLPSAATAGAGAIAYVTDSNSIVFNNVVAGGGANKVPVTSDGTNWRIG